MTGNFSLVRLLLEDALIFIDVKEKGEIEIKITDVNVGKRENE